MKNQLNLNYLLWAYKNYEEQEEFFLKTGFFDLLAGTNQLRIQIQQGMTEEQIRSSWQSDLKIFKVVREKYFSCS